MNNYIWIFGSSLVGIGIGAVAGYKLAEKKLAVEYREMLDKEIEETKNFYAVSQKGDFPTPADAINALREDRESRLSTNAGEALRRYQDGGRPIAYHKIAENDHKESATVTEIDPRIKPYDYAVEIPRRRTGRPYIIPKDDFYNNEKDFEQVTLVYYQADDTLAEAEDDGIVEDVFNTVGTEFLTRFGHGSEDPKVVYIRNEKLGVDYEITLSEISYKMEVLGFNDGEELRHSFERIPRRGRRLED